VGLGISRYRLRQDDRALAALNHALALYADVEHAHALLGDLYFRRDELKDSIRHYEAALRQDPSDAAVQNGLFTARRAHQAETHFDRVHSPHFIVKFEPAFRGLANQVIDRLDRLYPIIGRRLGLTAEDAMIVILYSDRQFAELTGSPAWAGSLYDGKIHLAGQTLEMKSLDATLAHEYTHAIVHRLSGGHAPTWLHEGLALYFEGRPVAWGRDILARYRDEIVPLHALHNSFLGLPSRNAQIAYAEGYGATRAMIDQYGFVLIRRLLETLAGTPDFAAAFETVFQTPYRDFEAAWVSELNGRRA
jgi:tetratricopeptide (TPR) repeat protein